MRSRSWKEGQTESIAQCRLPFLPYVPDTVPCFSPSVEIPDLQRENLVPGPASYSRRYKGDEPSLFLQLLTKGTREGGGDRVIPEESWKALRGR